jgi:hypothetical protein
MQQLTPEAHNEKLLQALHVYQQQVWPYDGPIGLIETNGTENVIHYLHQWLYYGSEIFNLKDAPPMFNKNNPVSFNLDDYKILCQAIYKHHQSNIIHLA